MRPSWPILVLSLALLAAACGDCSGGPTLADTGESAFDSQRPTADAQAAIPEDASAPPPDAAALDAASADAGPACADAGSEDAAEEPPDAAGQDPNGALPLLWATELKCAWRVNGVSAAPAGGVYAVGEFMREVVLDDGKPTATSLLSNGVTDGVVARYGSDGALQWARQVGGLGHDRINEVATLPDGSVVVAGEFVDTVSVGATSLTSKGTIDIFLARYDPTGTVVWVRQIASRYYEYPWALATSPGGDVYLAGAFDDVLVFARGEPNETALTTEGNHDLFLARYSSSGALLWARRAGGNDAEGGAGLAVSSAGVYLAGHFEGTATFGPGEPHQTVLTSSGSSDLFLARFDPTGELQWVKGAGGPGDDYGAAAAALPDGSAWLLGS